MGNPVDIKNELKSVGSETISDIKNGDCLTIACCDCKLTHNFIVKLKRGNTQSGDRASLSIFTDLKTTNLLRDT